MSTLFKIGELARRTDKTRRALHLYEERGLLTPARRSKGGFRLYDEENVRRVAFIDQMQVGGLSLGDVQALLRSWNKGTSAPDTMALVATEYRMRLETVRKELASLRAVEQELEASLEFLMGCRTCEEHIDTGTEACLTCARKQSEADNRLTLISGVTAH